MKTFNAARLTSSNKGPSNQQLHLEDSIGRPLELNLSPQAQQQLLRALLSSAALTPGTATELPSLQIQGIRRHTLSTGNIGLEIFLGPNQTIHLSIPPEGLKALREGLDNFDKSDTDERH